MESPSQNPEFRNNPENFHTCYGAYLKCIFAATRCGYKSSILSEPSSASIIYVCK